jgi:pantoate--beta-alanine ligase
MGYLHAGHESLMRRAAAENDRVVVSIFVNPAQFGPAEDLEAYPRDWGRDREACLAAGAAAVFRPSPEEMYPEGFAAEVSLPSLSKGLCGRSRPGHFAGVCLVCLKLFNIFRPDRAYFGLKDAQQFLILRRMARDLNLGLELRPCPTVREPDGLALSSRNAYLSPEERGAATVLSRALALGRRAAEGGAKASGIEAVVSGAVAEEPLARLEYARVVDTAGLTEVEDVDREVLCALAVRIGRTRLIDNFFFDPGDPDGGGPA